MSFTTAPPAASDDAARVAGAQLYDRLDAGADADLDDLTALAAQICGTSTAQVSLVNDERQWVTSRHGTSEADIACARAFRAHVSAGRDIVEVADAAADPRFAAMPPLGAEPRVRFCAGAPLLSSAGHALGALCVFDRAPRALTGEQRRTLTLLSRQAARRLEARQIAGQLRIAHAEHTAATLDLHSQAARLASSEERLSLVLASARAGIWEWDLTTGLISFDARFAAVVGIAPGGPLPVADVFQCAGDVELETLHAAFAQLFEGRLERLTHDLELAVGESGTRWARLRGHVTGTSAEGQPLRATGLVVDITDERRRDASERQGQRLDSIGALAAGVAHEMNTPLQFVSHNLDFLASHAATIAGIVDRLLAVQEALRSGADAAVLAAECEAAAAAADLPFIRDEFPAAIVESIDGIDRVTHIVRALKEFAHPGGTGRELVSMNRMIENAVTLTRHEWKFVATVDKDLDPDWRRCRGPRTSAARCW